MSKKSSIEAFIENRWAEAKTELEGISPAFVKTLQAYDALVSHGFVLPEGIPAPEQRLPVNWHDFLETTFDVTQAVERLDITLEFLESNSERRLAVYFYEIWVQSAYILCEKVEGLIAHTCKVHSINRKAKRAYYGLIKAEVREEIEKRRTAIVHGVNRPEKGTSPISATAITQDGLWEGGVFLGPKIIRVAIDNSYENGGYLTPKDYFEILKASTETVLDKMGGILELVDKDLRR
tara:strand:- start:170 stop:877 length:708 start_codon:yes stop_codon:yes gene_type:complete